jgi:hypothetical protein
MNLEQQKIVNNLTIISYISNTQNGDSFKKCLLICKYFHQVDKTFDGNTKVDNKNYRLYLESKYKILYNYVKDILPNNNYMEPNTIFIAIESYIVNTAEKMCIDLLDHHKPLILKELISNNIIPVYIIDFYLAGTHIGGSEKRGWDQKEKDDMIDFVVQNSIMVSEYANNAIQLGYDGKIYINNLKDFDMLGRNVHESFSMDQMQKKMILAEKDYEEKEYEKSLQKGIDEFIKEDESDDYDSVPHFSISGEKCLRKCELRKWPDKDWTTAECACPVQKKGWFGLFYDVEKCEKC